MRERFEEVELISHTRHYPFHLSNNGDSFVMCYVARPNMNAPTEITTMPQSSYSINDFNLHTRNDEDVEAHYQKLEKHCASILDAQRDRKRTVKYTYEVLGNPAL